LRPGELGQLAAAKHVAAAADDGVICHVLSVTRGILSATPGVASDVDGILTFSRLLLLLAACAVSRVGDLLRSEIRRGGTCIASFEGRVYSMAGIKLSKSGGDRRRFIIQALFPNPIWT
jgi:hypothetical protein